MKETLARILIIDDDLRTRSLLERYLKDQGFSVTTAENGRMLESTLAEHRVDLMVLDLMLPGADGLSLCRRLRATGHAVPIIMLTAKDDDVDRIVGLEVGADDYVSKPFNPRELVARIHAVLRRRQPPAAPGAPAAQTIVVHFGHCELNLGTRTLKKSGETLPLTTGDFAVLETLVSHPRQPLSREKLMELARRSEER